MGVREGQEYDAVLTIPLPDPVTTAPPASYTASITWGDGTPNSTAIATPVYSYSGGQLSGSLLVTASHVYAAAGNYTVSATATNPQTNNTSNGSQPLVVGDALLNPIPQTVSAVTGQATGTISVGQFFDDNTLATASAYTAQINWGDGSQASAGTVVAVSGGPAGTFAVQGSHTYSTTGTYSLTITVSDSGGQQATIASTAAVNPAWTLINLPADQGDATGARTMDPDRALSWSPGFSRSGEATIDLNQGAVRISHPLDFDQSPGTSVGGDPALDYNSATVAVRPVIQFALQSDPNTGDPAATQYAVQLTFNGVQQSVQTFPVSGYHAGAVYLMSVEVASAVAQTGVYNWSATVTITRSDQSTVKLYPSGYTPVVARDSSPYGAGWGIDGVPQLFPITANGNVPAGLLWVDGDGDSRFFTSNGNGTFSNPEDFGALVQNAGNTYTYTSPQQVQWNFNSSGLLTSVVQPDGLTLSYSYTNGLLTGVLAPDGGSTTLSYDSNHFLQTISRARLAHGHAHADRERRQVQPDANHRRRQYHAELRLQ